MPRLVLYVFLAIAFWVIRRDVARRDGVSKAIWIPTIWAAFSLSRPTSSWLGFGGGNDSMEGSPMDALVTGALILMSFRILARRGMRWSQVISDNWPVFLFYGYLLVSVLWAQSPFVSFKRWFKEFGNIAVLLVVLTEVNPQQAFRAIFVRNAYLMIPLSIIFIRWFPNLGRTYNIHSGEMEAIGVTFQKNSLGATVLVCTLVLIWDWIESTSQRVRGKRGSKVERLAPYVIFAMSAYLLYLCDSKTSISCLVLGGCILSAAKFPPLRQRIAAFGIYALAGIVAFFILDQVFGITEVLVKSMGRDMTFTGRTEVWHALLGLNTDPIFGTGFLSFWSDQHYQSQLPEWVAFSAHNGYLETYIDGGYIGDFFLILMLVALAVRINRQLAVSGNYALIRFAVLLVAVISDFSESNFGRMSCVGFLFLLSAIDIPKTINSLKQTRIGMARTWPQMRYAEPAYSTARMIDR